MPVPVIGIVAKWTMNTANPMGNGANTFNIVTTPTTTTKCNVNHETNSVDQSCFWEVYVVANGDGTIYKKRRYDGERRERQKVYMFDVLFVVYYNEESKNYKSFYILVSSVVLFRKSRTKQILY